MTGPKYEQPDLHRILTELVIKTHEHKGISALNILSAYDEIIATWKSDALRTQPQAPVDTRIPERLRGDPWVLQLMDWVDGKAPMVEVPTVEEIEQVLMSTLRPRVLINATGNKIRPKNVKMETNSAEVAQAIHALLQSKGGRG